MAEEVRKIEMGNSIAAGPLGVINPGEVKDVNKDMAKALVGADLAKYVRVISPEKATAKAADEKAVKVDTDKDKKSTAKKPGQKNKGKK